MSAIRECVKAMTAYVPGETPENSDAVKINQNENPYPPSPKVVEAMRRTFDSLRLYPESTSSGVRAAAAETYSCSPEQVMVSNGSDEMLRILFQSCCGEGDEVAGFYPGYTYYSTLAAIQNVSYRLVELNDDYSLPAKLDISGAKLAFLPNPNAPSGIAYPEKEVRRFIESVSGGLAVIDEAYADFHGKTAISLLSQYDNLVIVRTFSKGYSLAGLRVGLGFANAGLMAEFEKVRDYYNVDRAAQAGAEAALRDREWLRENTGRILASRGRLMEGLRELGLFVHESRTNFVLAKFGDAAAAHGIFRELRDRGIFTRYFSSRRLDDCLRITVGTEDEVGKLLSALKELLPKGRK